MAVSVIEDLIEGTSCVEDPTGLTIVRHFIVTGLASGPGIFVDAKAAAGIPQYGDPHPNATNIVVQRVEPKPRMNSKTEVNVYVTYKFPDFDLGTAISPIITYYGSTREALRSYDNTNAIITVGYSPTGAPVSFPDQIGRAPGTHAIGVLTYDFTTFFPPDSLADFLNKVSSSSWRGKPKWSWFCSNVEIEKVKYRSGWHVRMAFQLDESLFSQVVFYTLRDGNIPADVDTPVDKTVLGQKNGWTIVLEQNEADFNGMGLPPGF